MLPVLLLLPDVELGPLEFPLLELLWPVEPVDDELVFDVDVDVDVDEWPVELLDVAELLEVEELLALLDEVP